MKKSRASSALLFLWYGITWDILYLEQSSHRNICAESSSLSDKREISFLSLFLLDSVTSYIERKQCPAEQIYQRWLNSLLQFGLFTPFMSMNQPLQVENYGLKHSNVQTTRWPWMEGSRQAPLGRSGEAGEGEAAIKLASKHHPSGQSCQPQPPTAPSIL